MRRFAAMLLCLLCCAVCTGCLIGNYEAAENEELLVSNEVVMIDESERYRISFHNVTYEETDKRGGTWYDLQNDEPVLTFVFGNAGTMSIIRENSQVAFWDWSYDESDGTFTVNNFSSNYSGADLNELFMDKEFVFRAQE